MNQEPLFPYQRRFAYDLAKLQPVADSFNVQFRSGHQVEPVTQLLRHHDTSGTVDSSPHAAMVRRMAQPASTARSENPRIGRWRAAW